MIRLYAAGGQSLTTSLEPTSRAPQSGTSLTTSLEPNSRVPQSGTRLLARPFKAGKNGFVFPRNEASQSDARTRRNNPSALGFKADLAAPPNQKHVHFFHSANTWGSSLCSCSLMRACSFSGVSPGRTGTVAWARMRPASISAVTRCTVQPVSASPASMAN